MESRNHWNAKILLQKILLENGYSYAYDEILLSKIQTDLGYREYAIDVLAFKDNQVFAFEVDGYKGHSSKKDHQKMRLRDEMLLKHGIKTIRLQLIDLIGRKKRPIRDILEEIEYQISEQQATKFVPDILPSDVRELVNMNQERV